MKNKSLVLGIIIYSLLLTSCLATKKFGSSQVARAYLYTGKSAESGFGGYAYLLMQPPNPDPTQFNKDAQRLMNVCGIYHGYLASYESYMKQMDYRQLMIVYYLLRANTGRLLPEDCRNVLKTYDFDHARNMMLSVPEYINSEHKGPFIIAWDAPYEDRNTAGRHCMVIDMSEFSDVDVDRAMRIWLEHFAKEPELWNKGLSYVLAKEEVRNFVIKYSGCITEYFKK